MRRIQWAGRAAWAEVIEERVGDSSGPRGSTGVFVHLGDVEHAKHGLQRGELERELLRRADGQRERPRRAGEAIVDATGGERPQDRISRTREAPRAQRREQGGSERRDDVVGHVEKSRDIVGLEAIAESGLDHVPQVVVGVRPGASRELPFDHEAEQLRCAALVAIGPARQVCGEARNLLSAVFRAELTGAVSKEPVEDGGRRALGAEPHHRQCVEQHARVAGLGVLHDRREEARDGFAIAGVGEGREEVAKNGGEAALVLRAGADGDARLPADERGVAEMGNDVISELLRVDRRHRFSDFHHGRLREAVALLDPDVAHEATASDSVGIKE